MHLPGLTYRGAPLDDLALLERLPPDLQQLLAIRNGFVAFRGAVHVRGACTGPPWHSLRAAWEGPDAVYRRSTALVPADLPFAQDALGAQFILRDVLLYRLDPDLVRLEPLELDVTGFMLALYERPQELLPLDAVLQYEKAGGVLRPGQLLELTDAPDRAGERA